MATRSVEPTTTGNVVSAMSSLAQLDMSTLIAQPLHAVVDAQTELSLSTIKFIKDFAIDPSSQSLRNVTISQDSVEVLLDADGAPVFKDGSLQYVTTQNILNLPFITLLNVPSLQIKKFTIDLTIELVSVQDVSSTKITEDQTGLDAWNAGGGSAGNYRSYAKATSSETSSSSANQSIKYSLRLEAATTTPPGLTMLLDFLSRNKSESKSQIPINNKIPAPE
jgi:hypothetical protein